MALLLLLVPQYVPVQPRLPLRVRQKALLPLQPEAWQPPGDSWEAVLTLQDNPQRLKTASIRHLKTQ